MATFFFGLCICPRGPKRRLVWGVAVIVLCACILGARLEKLVQDELGAREDLGRQKCFEGWKGEESKLVRVIEELDICKAGAVPGELANAMSVDGGEVCDVGDKCGNSAVELVLEV